MKRIFIAWSGEVGRKIAEALAKTIFAHHPDITPWVSSSDITLGASWFTAIDDALTSVDFAIGILTPGASAKPWMNFEAGYVFSRLKNFKLLRFGDEVTGPLTLIQAVDGTDPENLVRILHEVTSSGTDGARRWVQTFHPDFKQILDGLEPELHALAQAHQLSNFAPIMDRLQSNPVFAKNLCLQHVISESVNDFFARLKNIQTSFSIPASSYPQYLIRLQEGLNANTRAIALINYQEKFWQDAVAREILRTSREDNERVFVFNTREDFDRNFSTMEAHADRYKVWAMSLETLTREFYPFNRDFSIVTAEGASLLGVYDHSGPESMITFSADSARVAKYEDQFRRIRRLAVRVDSHDVDEVKKRVFGRRMTDIDRRPVEMSAYISIEDYDSTEEEHAYYVPMMERMIRIFEDERGGRAARVLELGAGTGIFTKRLAALQNTDVEAIELDWACFRRLKHNRDRAFPKVTLYHQDSRTFDPEGQYDFIFSSFADHHIRFEDRSLYFENIKRNLKPDGLYIVGDEFLPPHDRGDENERKQALELYHHHIISKATNPVLIQLETQALQSGLERIGDFKTSLDDYITTLKREGFNVRFEKIGPEDLEGVGGVYVLVARAT